MPCKDTTAQMVLKLNNDQEIVGFNYVKMTCQKTIGGESGLNQLCQGKSLNQVTRWSWAEVCQSLELSGEEEQFLAYLEWQALGECVKHGLGEPVDAGEDSCSELVSLQYGPEEMEICVNIKPPANMPKVIPCGLAKEKNDE